MHTELVLMTPEWAKELLKKNAPFNRPLRKTTVELLAGAILRDEWVTSHQGIAISKSGYVIDGQHRLAAIVKAGIAVLLMVTYDVDDHAFKVIDIGLKRTPADALNVAPHLAACARFIAIVEDSTHNACMTPQFLAPYVDAIEYPLGWLLSAAPTVAKTWSAAAVRAAAVLRLMDGADEEYVLKTYDALVRLQYEHMPPIAHVLVRQREKGLFQSANIDMFLRCLKVFNPAQSQMQRIEIGNADGAMKYARGVIAARIHACKSAPPGRATAVTKAQPFKSVPRKLGS